MAVALDILILQDNMAVALDILILQDEHNIIMYIVGE